MATAVTAPSMGEGIEELSLVRWLKREGEAVKEFEPIAELETDKVATELPSPADGVVIKIIGEEDSVVRVGEILAWIGEPGEEVPQDRDSPGKAAKEQIQIIKQDDKKKPEGGKKDAFLSPLVRKMLQEHAIDLSAMVGTGKSGRITKQDVLTYLETKGKSTSSGSERIEKLSSMRRTIAERMTESLRTSAHVLTVMEADMTRVMTHRKTHKPIFAESGLRLTFTAYFIHALAPALKAYPRANSSWIEEGLLIHADVNIGMAVSLGEEGLIVPVIRLADTLSLREIAHKIEDLATRARSKKLKPEEVRNGTFSLTNHGLSGSLFATPIITQPQVGILGTGRIQKRAVVISDETGNDALAIHPMVYLSYVFDHRVLDGEGADNFLNEIKNRLENWEQP